MHLLENIFNELGYEKIEYSNDHPLIDIAKSLGYKPELFGTTYDDGTPGIVVQFAHTNYNNGYYMLRETTDGKYFLEVLVPNTVDKSNLIANLHAEIVNKISQMDIEDLDVYDWNILFGLVIDELVVKPLATVYYGDDQVKTTQFRDVYFPRFLSNTGVIHMGSEVLHEETVNSEPYALKIALDKLKETDDKENE